MKRMLLVSFLVALSCAAQKTPQFTTQFSKQEFADRRAKVATAIGKTAIAVVRGREDLPNYEVYRENNELFYLTGTEGPGALLLIDGATGRSTMFMPAREERRQKFEGALLGPDEASSKIAGIDIRPLDQFTIALSTMARDHGTGFKGNLSEHLRNARFDFQRQLIRRRLF